MTRFSFGNFAEPAEEDGFLWSLADLMTLLLIFFILLYANTLPQPEAEIGERGTVSENNFVPLEIELNRSLEPLSDEPFEQEISDEYLPKLLLPDEPAPVTPTPVTPTPVTPTPMTPTPITNDSTGSIESLDTKKMEALEKSFSSDFYIRWDERIPVFVLGERITFNIGKALLLVSSRSALRRIVDIIVPLEDYQIIVSGHTDNVAINTPIFPSNWELSAARAASVAKFLVSQGIDPKRLIIQGKAEYHPLVSNSSNENRRMNRRVEISLLQEKQIDSNKP